VKVLFALLAAIGLLYALHRMALSAEDRGWVYYLNRKPNSSTLGNAFLEIQSMIEPEKRSLVEARKEETVEEDEQGDPPEAGRD
jgi:hypothetical protein